MSKDTPLIRLTKNDEFSLIDEPVRYAEIEEWCEENLLPVLQALPNGQRSYIGEDFARSGDLSVISVGQEQPDLTLKEVLVLEMSKVPFKQQEQIYYYIGDRLPRLSKAANDGRGNGQFLSEAAFDRYGQVVESVMLSESWYAQHAPPFKAALEDGTFTVSRATRICSTIYAPFRWLKVYRASPTNAPRAPVARNATVTQA